MNGYVTTDFERGMYVGRQLEARQFKEENAKLRELLADMFHDFVCCDMALREHGRTYLAYTRYINRMRELGIEVNE